uniref:NADH-ubiquinone oxidoreductase chain 4L n=1 Tax=Anoplodactylus australis TaxID=2992006 RepID=A0A9E7V7C5_9CHEL|nr:NADH dehydrogenase subunit 4L [Anoplodactylus australis]UZA61244.1 NADH dehydrogenase subunit 4L [Anoplodactylus australis]
MQNSSINFIYITMLMLFLLTVLNLKYHLLSLLLCLEMMMLFIFLSLSMLLMKPLSASMILYYLTIGVCEGGLGLSFLVLLIRSHGDDYSMNLDIMM